MGLLAPLGLGLLALAAPIVALYMLKMRRREHVVSSTFLWEQALRDVQANAPWQRLRPSLLLVLQLLALAALVFALARPFWVGAAPLGANLVVVLDVSASMSATDVAPSRLAQAKDDVRKLIADLPAGGAMTLIAAGTTAEVLQPATGNQAALREAVDRAEGQAGATDLRDALALAVPAARRLPDTTVVIVSDGAFPDSGLADLGVPVRLMRVGQRADNLAITAAATRRDADGTQLFVRVQNFGPAARRTLLSVYADGALFDARDLDVPAGGEAGATIGPLPPAVGLLRAEIEAKDDLALDNVAWVRPGAAGKLRALLVTSGQNTFLERGLALQPNLVLDRAGDGRTPTGQGGDYDLYVFDGVAPPADLRGPVLLINPPANNGVVTVAGTLDRPAVTAQDRADPIMRDVDLTKIQIAQAEALDRPDWARTLAESDGHPLLLAGEPGGRRTAVLAFDLHRSDLPLTLNFPILLANLTAWLAPDAGSGLPDQVAPGAVVTIAPRPSVDTVAVTDPAGRESRLAPSRGAVLYAATGALGPYTVRELQSGREVRRGVFTVSLLNADESNIAPRDLPPGLAGGAAQAGESTAARARREVWPALLAVGLAVLAAEWWIFYRGAALPRPRRPRRLPRPPFAARRRAPWA
ncbi:MAG TPA: VWA domain-containing protein [Thermomicrobiales bacterium]|nr:VWA domain-containing protein [Thermomicrobiales bacterium]